MRNALEGRGEGYTLWTLGRQIRPAQSASGFSSDTGLSLPVGSSLKPWITAGKQTTKGQALVVRVEKQGSGAVVWVPVHNEARELNPSIKCPNLVGDLCAAPRYRAPRTSAVFARAKQNGGLLDPSEIGDYEVVGFGSLGLEGLKAIVSRHARNHRVTIYYRREAPPSSGDPSLPTNAGKTRLAFTFAPSPQAERFRIALIQELGPLGYTIEPLPPIAG